jgi:hypothetical protein
MFSQPNQAYKKTKRRSYKKIIYASILKEMPDNVALELLNVYIIKNINSYHA